MQKDKTNSFTDSTIKLQNLTIEQSNVIKGIAILFVILGHNHILAPVGSYLFGWIYSFHLVVFFILPFFYDKPVNFNFKILENLFIRNYVPFFIFFLLLYFLFHIVINKDGIGPIEIVYGLFNGSAAVIKQSTGFVFLWFLPAYFSMAVIRGISSKSKYIFNLLFVSGLLLSLNWDFTWNILYVYVPFGIMRGLYYFTFGVITLFLVKRVPYMKQIGAFIFVVITTLYWLKICSTNEYLFGISAFLFLMTTVDFLKNIRGLQLLGQFSLGIYLIHVLVYNVLEKMTPNFQFIGWVIYLITIVISLSITLFLMKIDRLRKFFFPKNLTDWMESIKF